jgi:Photosystem I psaA/psaB protein
MEQQHFRCLLITLGLVVSSSWAAALMGPVMGSGSRDPNPAGHRTSGTAFISSEASVNGTTAYTGIRLTGTADLLVHHIHAFTIHVTALNGTRSSPLVCLKQVTRGPKTGFHAFGMYIHNDTLLALGRESDQFGDTGIPFRPAIGLPLTGLGDFESINLDGPKELRWSWSRWDLRMMCK